MLKKALCIGMFLLLAVTTYTFFTQKEASKDTLTVGMMSGWAPFMSINANGSFEGFDVDIAQSIAQRMGKKLIIKDMGSLASCFTALEQNMVNMLFSGLDITPKRQETLEMIPYAGQETREYYLVFYKNVPEGITSLEDFKNRKDGVICVEPGSSPEKLLDRYTYITQKPLSSLTDMMLDVQYGKSRAAFLEPFMARKLEKSGLPFASLPLSLPQEFYIFGYGVALKKGSFELRDQVVTIVEQLKKEGIIKQLEAKWNLTGD